MISLKPHLALMIIVALPYFVWRAGFGAMITSVELWAAGAVCALYAAAIGLFFPAYLERIAPLAFAVYTPLRYSWSDMVGGTAFRVWLALGAYLIVVARRRLTDPLIATTALASVGAMLAYFIQGKGWAYQSYPAIALIAIAFIAATASESAPQRRLWAAAAFSILIVAASNITSPQIVSAAILLVAPLGVGALIVSRVPMGFSLGGWPVEFSTWIFASIAAAAWLWFDHTIPPFSFEAKVAALTPHPKIAAIAGDLNAFPFLRRIGGVWIQRANCLWITTGAQTRVAQSGGDPSIVAQMQPYLKLDRDTLIEDIERNKPDIILVSNRLHKLRDWAFAEPQVAAALADYRLYASDKRPGGETFLYARADLLALRSAPAD
jgi:hypothetical protein